MRNHLLNLLLKAVMLLSLCSCAVITHESGIALRNPNYQSYPGIKEIPISYRGRSELRFDSPPLHVRMGQSPKTEGILLGPGILLPLPIIPWIPGIVKALINHRGKPTSTGKVHIILDFYRKRWNRDSGQYRITPKDVTLTVEGNKHIPIAWKYDVGRVYVEHIKPRPKSTACYSEEGDNLLIQIDQDSDCGSVKIDLTFDLTYRELVAANLSLGTIMVEDKEIELPETSLHFDKGFSLLWYQTIND